ncbi:unnamed protein product [Kluyveromyces dobzhanskii CBS 2104]|uniref:Autophagy-related protein 13 n=1 Tax=Kluyveromyces dobzhanskii CBS 2104 TaxID=1427455 RepID=A0A0A8L1V0_9SACH|nr:unnamed protein product [Kluyveromyces dobzhanskii CBS 2104]
MPQGGFEIIDLINNFFLKAALLLEQCKVAPHLETGEALRDGNHLFNIETRGDPSLEAQIQPWVTFDGVKTMPPLVLETYLDLRSLHSTHTIYLHDTDGNPWMVCKGGKKSEIVLERWLIELDKQSIDDSDDANDPENLHKQLVLLFRYLYTLTQLLPSNDIIAKSNNSQQTALINVNTRLLDGSKPILSKGRIGLSKPIIASYSNIMNETNIASHLDQRKITPIKTRYGSLRITVSYRKDVDFYIIDSDDLQKRYITPSSPPDTSSMPERRTSSNSNVSMSVSPKTNTINANLLPLEGSAARRQSISSKLQPFKVGSVGSGSFTQNGSVQSTTSLMPSLSRNVSSSSVAAALKVQRGSAGSAILNNDLPPELSSVGSGSKYSSSFGRIRRHSSMRRSESIDRTVKPIKSSDNNSPEDLLEFVKLLEDKKELNMKPSTLLPQQDISNSLMRFQSMKINNDALSDNLSMSMSIDQPNVRFGSNSHSPIPSFSPNYCSIPSRLSHGSRNNSNVELITSRKSSLDRNRHNLLSRTGSNLEVNRRGSIGTMETTNEESKEDEESHMIGLHAGDETAVNEDDRRENEEEEEEEEEEMLMKRSSHVGTSDPDRFSASPRSLKSISVSSYTRNQLPLKHLNLSHPTTSATTTHAKFHKSELSPDPLHRVNSQHHSNSQKNDEDDDLLFVMSDMNLTN